MNIGVGAQLLSYPRAQRGGLGSYMRNLVAALPEAASERGHQVHLFWGSEGRAVASELGLDDPSICQHFSRLPLSRRPARLPWEQFALPFAARAANVRVFHFLDHVASVIPPAPRTVVTIHDMASFLFPETFGSFRGRYKSAMTRLSARSARRVIAISEATKRDIIRLLGIPERRVRVVYYGLNPLFRRVEDPRVWPEVRARYGLPERFLIFVGTLEPRKNVERIIRGYALARERHGVRTPLVLAGQRGWLYERSLKLPAALGIAGEVLFKDFIPQRDLPAVYSQAEAFVFPTLYEGFGLPPLEAMACGAPVIASNVSATPEVVGDAGLLVDPLNPDEIAEAIWRASSDRELRGRLAEAGPRRAGLFSWERAARETVAVYEEAARCSR